MPRTKAVRKKPEKSISGYPSSLIAQLELIRKEHLRLSQESNKQFLSKLKLELTQSKLSIPAILLNKTIGELMELPRNWSGNVSSVSTLQFHDVTKTFTEKKRPLLRSSSWADDEGYLTAESSNGTSGGRPSRARSKQQATKRMSRSVTRATRTIANKFKTPAGKAPPNSYGTVTPKVQPNTPQVLLRRPKMGEVALSLQGSPLLTGSVMTDNVANINIPLEDGRLLSIQPQRGLRMSQIPQLDPETKRQLETLRDNLNKVCSLTAASR